MIKTVGELRVRLEGKTERTAIETILNGATIAAMKGYIAAERYDICTGRNLVKADYVKALTSVVYSLVPEENPASVADKNVLSFFNTILASNIDTEKYVRVFASMCLYEKITSTSEPHKFSNLPEAEIRMMLGFEANYVRLGDERGMYGLFTNDLNTVNVEDTAKAAKYFVELVHSVFQSDFERATGQTGAEGTKEEEAMTVAETIKTAGTVDAIAETLMKCGKVNDMALAFRTVTGRDFTGRIVGVNKDNLSYDMAREIKMQFERESFAALTVSEKINFLCERDAYDKEMRMTRGVF